VTNKVVNTSPMSVDRVQGYFRGAVPSWLQLHDAKKLPANGAVPFKTFQQPTAAAFHWGFDPGEINTSTGFVVAISTTEATLTISAELADIQVDGEAALDDTGFTSVGDYTTAIQNQTVWSSANGPHTLRRVEFTALSGAGASLYAKVYGNEAPLVGQLPLATMKLTIGTSKDFLFNFSPAQRFSDFPDGKGCLIVLDSTPGVLVGSYAGTDFAIKSSYDS